MDFDRKAGVCRSCTLSKPVHRSEFLGIVSQYDAVRFAFDADNGSARAWPCFNGEFEYEAENLFFAALFFIPSILSVSVISFVAIFMLQPYIGVVNNIIQMFGSSAEPFWLATPSLAWVSIVGVTLWWTVGFNMILFLTALQNIPDDLYESAEIDGATRSEMFWNITLPNLIPIGRVVLLLQVLGSFKVFAQILLITDGGPGTATRPIIQYIYEMGFVRYDLGYAAAISYILFIVLLILSIVQLRFGGRGGRMI